MLRWIVVAPAFFLLLAGVSGCGSDSPPRATPTPTPFVGIDQTYTLASGNRKLQLNGQTGTYAALTIVGNNTLAVSLTQSALIIGGLSFPYLAAGNLIQGGGYEGYASSAVISDPTRVPGVYNTLTGANFGGQLTIVGAGRYMWCRRSTYTSSGTCADGGTAATGSIEILPARGFRFSEISGTSAVYRKVAAAALFPIDNRGFILRALSQSAVAPSGTFSQALRSANESNHIATVSFLANNRLTIEGVQNFAGSYTYTFANGALSFPSASCRSGTCIGIYNNALGIVYLAQVGDVFFFTH